MASSQNSTKHRSSANANSLRDASPHFGDVSLWPLESNELVLFTIDGHRENTARSFSREKQRSARGRGKRILAALLPSHSSLGTAHLSIRPIVWQGSRQQWQPPPVFITADFPDGGKSFCMCSRNGCGEGEGARERKRGCETKERRRGTEST